MKKHSQKILSVFIAFVMAVAMIPIGTLKSEAKTAMKTIYEKVTSTSSWDSDAKYIIYSNGHALSYNNGSIGDTSIDLSNKNSELPDSILWTITPKAANKNDKFKISNDNNGLKMEDKKGLSLNKNGDDLNIKVNSDYSDYMNIYKDQKNYLMFDNSWKTGSKNDKDPFPDTANIEIYKVYQIEDLKSDDKLYEDDTTIGTEYPEPGTVKIDKQATSSGFDETGLSRVELSTTGIPIRKGCDIVLILDVSSSMGNGNTEGTKLYNTKKAAENFVNEVLGDSIYGEKSNNRLALVTFAGNNSGKTGIGNQILFSLTNANSKDKVIDEIRNLQHEYGTDYDYAFDSAERILENADSNREKYVIFMTDGEPYRYNGKGYVDFTNGVPEKHNVATRIKDNDSKLKLYTIGFDITGNTTAQKVLQGISSGDGYYIDAADSDQLNEAFEEIASSMQRAGIEGVVTDKMGKNFKLQMGQRYPEGTTTSFPSDFDTTIKVSNYKLDSNGERTGDPTNIETVTFSEDGKTATSDQLSDTNIIKDNKIQAKYFTYDLETETFTWTIGDITHNETVLSYPVYLKDSIEGKREAGNYDTNEYAKLNYVNPLGEEVTKEFRKPSLPWKSSQVNIEYYLVNEDGQPINSAGKVVSYENRIIISSETRALTKGTNLNEKASDNIPDGYKLHNEDAFYKVDKVGTQFASRTYSDDNSTKVTGDKPYTTSSVAFGVMKTTDLKPDLIVLDYGKPVTFNVLKNDGLKDITLNGIATQSETTLDTELNKGVADNHNNQFTDEATDKYGKLVLKNEKGDVTYKLSKYMDGIDKFYYEVKGQATDGQNQSSDFYKYSSINIMPATSVYYEDNFSDGTTNADKTTNGIVFNGSWTVVKDEENTSHGEEQDSDQGKNATYGKDSSYANDSKFSYGSAHVVTAEKGKPASAKFTFKGTGFEIISRTDNSTGMMNVKVYDSNNKLVKNIPCNTVYKEKNGALYQIPVISVNGLDYGQYSVVIVVTGVKEQDGTTKDSTVYIDGVRIFNPINQNGTDEDSEIANKKYKDDNEANQVVYEIRNLLIDNNDFAGGTEANGCVYVDSNGTVQDKKTYENLGPNNEVYLKKGNSIGFKLKSSQPASIKIGLKTPNGESGEVTIGSNKDSSGNPINLSTATSMYYDVTDKIIFDNNNEAYVVITNTGDTDAIVSLTKIKFTFEETPEIAPQLVVSQEDAQYIANMALTRNGIEVNDDNKDQSSDDNKDQSSDNDKDQSSSQHGHKYDITNTIKKVIKFFKNLFKR